ncbi:vWA domain-containing protein [Haloarchaeobius salinus]|uniref:vWA domain-containing protein n=1 Tax=Haloarchaeobius salinus TaxID=1198298 RepID=UPI00210E19E6|nr:VWA domain-containing protein [Haloarchaeobius salinus]
MSPRRRRSFLALATATAASLAGCSTGSNPGNPETEPPTNLPTTAPPGGLVDDWQFDPADIGQGDSGSSSGGSGGSTNVSYTVQADSANAGSIGLAAGGAKDVNNFRQNVEEGFLPLPSDMPYEGLFYDYYFDTGSAGECDSLFCPRYAPAVSADPLSGETERYLSVGLNSGLDADDFERKRLNFVVVLDVSGSMGSPFDEYHYDQDDRAETDDARPKIEVARDALASLTEQLRPGDRFGVVLYNDQATVAKPLNPVETTDMEAIRGHIEADIEAGGGTDLSAGLDEASSQFDAVADADPAVYENRMVVLTDAMPNLGDTSEGGLRGRLADEAERDVHATFVGVGVDFNTEIIDAITSVRGANHYSVHSASEFEERLTDGFQYMVTPLVFDLSLELDAEGYEIETVYGSSAADEATGEVMHVNTLFASDREGGETKGGVVLAKLRKTGDDGSFQLRASWENRSGETSETTAAVDFPDGGPEQFANTGVRKAVLLTRYADLCRNWAVAMREDDGEPPGDGIDPVDYDDLGRWERQSTELTVSPEYADRFASFAEYFEDEMAEIGDEGLSRELSVLERLADASVTTRRLDRPGRV